MTTDLDILGIKLDFISLDYKSSEFIPVEYVHYIHLAGITTDIEKTKWSSLNKKIYAEEFVFTIDKEILNKTCRPKKRYIELFEHLSNCHDLCYITIVYKDKQEEKIYMPWKNEDNDIFTNIYMTTVMNEDGITIKIKRPANKSQEKNSKI